MRILSKIIFYSIVSFSILGCISNSNVKKIDNLALFSVIEKSDSVSMNIKKILNIDDYIAIPKNQVLINKVTELMDSVSKHNFNNLRIEVLGIETSKNSEKTLKINLKENSGFVIPDSLGKYRSWYDFFQGSDGGETTTMILTESTLQRQFNGDWVDAVEFYYQGEEIGEWDHINLSGHIKRK
jgi:hypothetical protein